MSHIVVDRSRPVLPALTADGSTLPESLKPLTDHVEAIGSALVEFDREAALIGRDPNLSASGRSEKLKALGQSTLDAVAGKFDKPIELIASRAAELSAAAEREAVAKVDSTRALVLAQRIGGLERSARLRIIGASLKANDIEALGTLALAPESLGIFSGLDPKLREHVHDAFINAAAPDARKNFEQAGFALTRSRAARETLQRKIQETSGLEPPRKFIHTRLSA